MRFFAGKTQMEIAEEIGISQAQVSRIEKKALGILRELNVLANILNKWKSEPKVDTWSG